MQQVIIQQRKVRWAQTILEAVEEAVASSAANMIVSVAVSQVILLQEGKSDNVRLLIASQLTFQILKVVPEMQAHNRKWKRWCWTQL